MAMAIDLMGPGCAIVMDVCDGQALLFNARGRQLERFLETGPTWPAALPVKYTAAMAMLDLPKLSVCHWSRGRHSACARRRARRRPFPPPAPRFAVARPAGHASGLASKTCTLRWTCPC